MRTCLLHLIVAFLLSEDKQVTRKLFELKGNSWLDIYYTVYLLSDTIFLNVLTLSLIRQFSAADDFEHILSTNFLFFDKNVQSRLLQNCRMRERVNIETLIEDIYIYMSHNDGHISKFNHSFTDDI